MPGRQGIGFSPEIETDVLKPFVMQYMEVARGLASRLRLKPTYTIGQAGADDVARGLASRLRLKRVLGFGRAACCPRRQGIGFSPEIETLAALAAWMPSRPSPGDWLLA